MTVYTQVTRIKWTLYDHFLELAKLLFSYEAILLVPHIQWLQKKWKTQTISTKHDLNQTTFNSPRGLNGILAQTGNYFHIICP